MTLVRELRAYVRVYTCTLDRIGIGGNVCRSKNRSTSASIGPSSSSSFLLFSLSLPLPPFSSVSRWRPRAFVRPSIPLPLFLRYHSFYLSRRQHRYSPPPPPPPPRHDPPFDERYCRNNESGFVLWSRCKTWPYFKFAAFYRIRYLSTDCTSRRDVVLQR